MVVAVVGREDPRGDTRDHGGPRLPLGRGLLPFSATWHLPSTTRANRLRLRLRLYYHGLYRLRNVTSKR